MGFLGVIRGPRPRRIPPSRFRTSCVHPLRHHAGAMSHPLALTRSDGEGAFLSVLKGLEIQKTLGSDPVLTALRHFPAQPAQVADFPEGLHPKLRETLVGRGIERLYTHQREAWTRSRRARTSWSSPRPPPARPSATTCPCSTGSSRTRMRAPSTSFRPRPWPRTSWPELHGVSRGLGARHRDLHLRRRHAAGRAQGIRARAHVVLTNPDMLHSGHPAPPHPLGSKLFANLRYVVIDEIHTYRGVFGSPPGQRPAAARRICAFYGSRPQFICSSATIANPREHAGAAAPSGDDAGRSQRRAARGAALRSTTRRW